MGKNDTCLIKMEAIDAWKRAAEENGLKYEAVLEAVGMSNRSMVAVDKIKSMVERFVSGK